MEAVFAVSIQIVSSGLTALGYALQKQAHTYAAKNSVKSIKLIRFWVGLFIMLGGTPLNIWALTMADQTLLSALAPFSIIFTLVLGRFMLKEEILLKHYISCFFMSVGSILALIFASKHSETLKIQEIQSRILSTISIITTTTNIILLTLLLLLSFKIIRDIKVASKSFTDTQMNQCLLKDNYLQSVQRSDFTRDSETLRVTVEISEFQEETQGQFFRALEGL